MDLKHRAVTSTAWYAGTRLATQLTTWLITLFVARLLNPSDYGLFAMALAVIAFLELFQEFGLGVAIIQKQNLTREQLNTVFWTSTAASTLLAGIAYTSAGLAASFYHEPRLVSIIRLLGLTFLINALGMVPFNLLTKEINFRQRSLAEGIAAVSSAGISLVLAALGRGVWALVVGNLTRVVVVNMGALLACRWLPGLRISLLEMKELLAFGLRVAGTSAVNTLSQAVNTSIIGRFLGGADLGFYTMADTLGRSNPLHKISTAVVTQLSLPIFSKVQRDDAELRYYFLKISRYVTLMALPLQLGVALTASDLVDVLLSTKWRPIVPILQAFSIGGILSILPLPAFPLLTARGRVALVFRYTVTFACVMALVTWGGTLFGLRGVALSWLIAFPLLRLIPLRMSLQEAAIAPREYIATIVDSVKAAGIMTAAVAAVIYVLLPHAATWLRLAAAIAIGTITYIAPLFILNRSLRDELREIVRALVPASRDRGVE